MNDGTHELIPDNNTAVSARFGLGVGPDLIVTAINGPVSNVAGQPINATVEVCNQGTQARHTWVELLYSRDAVITRNGAPGSPPDSLVGTTHLDTIEAGQCQTASMVVPSARPGRVGTSNYLGAIVNPGQSVAESFEDNNTQVSAPISVTP